MWEQATEVTPTYMLDTKYVLLYEGGGSRGSEIYYLYNQWLSPLLINVASSNPAHVEVYSIHYVIKFVSDLQLVGGFLHQ